MRTQIRSRTKISVSGKKLSKFINELHSQHILCTGQFCCKDVFYCEILSSELEKVKALAEEYELELNAAVYDSLSGKILRYRRRTGIIIGFAIVIAASLYFSNTVVTIEIQGNSKVSDSAILAALDELDIRQGTFLKDIDFHTAGNRLRVMIDGISWASLRHTGNRVVVEVTEVVEKPQMLSSRVPCNLIASHDAEITHTSVYDGLLMHKVGDFVPKGTLLVTGITNDTRGNLLIHHAMGDIRGIYTEKLTFSGEFVSVRSTSTGNCRKENYLRLFNLKIPLFFGKNKFELYSCEETDTPLSLFGKELPVGTIKKKISENERSETSVTPDELRKELMDKVYLYEKNFFSEDTVILERNITEDITKTGITLNAEYKLEGNICSASEILLK